MNSSLKKVIWIILCSVVVLTIIFVLFQLRRGKIAQQELADTRRALREQGFKTVLADFDVTTDAASRAHEMALMVFDTNPDETRPAECLDLMPVASNDTATVIWKQDWLMTGSGPITWETVRHHLAMKLQALDAACEVMLSNPIRLGLDASKGSGMFISHISSLTHLCSALNVRAIWELHDGHPDAAWTNLFAATRLATAWESNASVSYHLFRAGFVTYAFATTWQALQYGNWPDAKLARLQQEWESPNFFTNVPETAAFDDATSLEDCRGWALQPLLETESSSEFLRQIIHYPADAYDQVKHAVRQMHFRDFEVFVDEKNLLLDLTNREAQFHRAIQAPTWAEMRALPGVTDGEPFQCEFEPAWKNINFHREPAQGVLARIAPAEARRRILIVAIVLERYRGKHGEYPATLAALTPEFLKAVPVDFMDGKSLRYRLTDDGHFVLYSVGMDCVDDGGKQQSLVARGLPFGYAEFWYPKNNVDIVWPRPVVVGVPPNHP